MRYNEFEKEVTMGFWDKFSEYKNKLIVFFFIFWIFLMQNYLQKNTLNVRKLYTSSYNVYQIAKNYNKDNVSLILRGSDWSTSKIYGSNAFKVLLADPINLNEDVKNKIEKIKKEEKNPIIFTPLINQRYIDTSAKGYTCYFNPTIDLCIWKIE